TVVAGSRRMSWWVNFIGSSKVTVFIIRARTNVLWRHERCHYTNAMALVMDGVKRVYAPARPRPSQPIRSRPAVMGLDGVRRMAVAPLPEARPEPAPHPQSRPGQRFRSARRPAALALGALVALAAAGITVRALSDPHAVSAHAETKPTVAAT